MPFASTLHVAACADPGLRTLQEDVSFAAPTLGLFAVADATGAMASGRHAAELALATLEGHVRQPFDGPLSSRLREAIGAASDAVFARTDAAARHRDDVRRRGGVGRDPEVARWLGVGTTLVALLVASAAAVARAGPPHRPGAGDTITVLLVRVGS